MKKSSAICVSAIALALAMFVPLKASAQGVSIYIGPGYPGYGAGYPGYALVTQATRIRLIPDITVAIPLTATPIQATAMPIQAMATAVLITALIGARGRRVARRVNRRWDRWD